MSWSIRMVNTGKKYRVSTQPGNSVSSVPVTDKGIFWALRNISVEIERGEIFGIIGANGAGKSTLLKVLTGVTAPSEGAIEVNGRLNALLELGTGFHPELNGLENILIGAALQGFPIAQVRKKMQSIADFSRSRI